MVTKLPTRPSCPLAQGVPHPTLNYDPLGLSATNYPLPILLHNDFYYRNMLVKTTIRWLDYQVYPKKSNFKSPCQLHTFLLVIYLNHLTDHLKPLKLERLLYFTDTQTLKLFKLGMTNHLEIL